jgi:pimeloyl-ACP methyl ester carboxylesterase
MRLVLRTLSLGLIGCCALQAAQAMAGAAATAQGRLPLHECRLEHPQRLGSVAARCGVLRVPEDRLHPEGAAIELSVAVVPALDRRSEAAPLFILAGGPGQGAAALYASYAGAFARINREHDIVLVDQRGTGKSAPLFCDYPDEWQELEMADDTAALRKATTDCLAKFGPRVRYYTTSAAIQDLDDVRRALGLPQIDLYGSSYGTRVAEAYMRRYPDSVHAAILDGVVDPELAIGPETPLDGEAALSLIMTRCRESRDCSAAYPQLSQDLDGLRRKFGPQKQIIDLDDPRSGLPRQIEFNRSLLNASLRFLSYGAASASLLPALIHQAALGNLRPLAVQAIMVARQVGDQLASGMQNSVVCSEDVPFYAAAGIDRARIAETYQGTDQLDALTEICRLWPRGTADADLHSALHSAIPTLLLSGEADPVTPPRDAERLARGLLHHRHLVLPGEGHGQLATGCVPRLMAEFLNAAAPEKLDAACLKQQSPPAFFVSLTGPAP